MESSDVIEEMDSLVVYLDLLVVYLASEIDVEILSNDDNYGLFIRLKKDLTCFL